MEGWIPVGAEKEDEKRDKWLLFESGTIVSPREDFWPPCLITHYLYEDNATYTLRCYELGHVDRVSNLFIEVYKDWNKLEKRVKDITKEGLKWKKRKGATFEAKWMRLGFEFTVEPTHYWQYVTRPEVAAQEIYAKFRNIEEGCNLPLMVAREVMKAWENTDYSYNKECYYELRDFDQAFSTYWLEVIHHLKKCGGNND